MFDFSELSVLGWIALIIRVAYIISVIVKPNWHFNYEERLIQLRDVDKYVYNETTEWIYMGLRFVVISGVALVVTGWFI